MSVVFESGGYLLSLGGSEIGFIGTPPPPPPSGNTQQIKFASGFMMASAGGDYGTTLNGTYPATTEVPLAKAAGCFIGYMMAATAYQLEDYTQPSNIALTAGGLTGAALQAKINQEYPGFANNLAAIFYYQQAIWPGSYWGAWINFWDQNPNEYINSVITQDWTWATNGYKNPIVPRDVMNCGGSITVPNSYGSAATTPYAVDPIYNGSNGYGFMFSGYTANTSGPGGLPAFSAGAVPNWCNVGINQRQRMQLLQALALFTLPPGSAWTAGTYTPGMVATVSGTSYLCTANTNVAPPSANWVLNTFAGMTFEQIPQVLRISTNDEDSWTFTYNIAGGQNVNPPYNGLSGYTYSGTTFYAADAAQAALRRSLFPTTPSGDCRSDGTTFGNNYITQAQVTSNVYARATLRGWAMGNADYFANLWNLNSWTNPQANWSQAGFIGIPNPPLSWPSGLVIANGYVSADDLRGKALHDGQTQGALDYSTVSGTGLSANTAQVVTACIQGMQYAGCQLAMIDGRDNTYNYATLESYVVPGINAAITAGYSLSTLLPVLAMSGPSISSVIVNSPMNATVNWAPITNVTNAIGWQGSGLSFNVYRNGTLIASPAASLGTYIDPGYTTGASYTLQMVNANGTGPQGPIYTGTPPAAEVGVPYEFQPFGMGNAPYSLSGAPAWANINPSTGLIYGIPTATGLVTFNVIGN